MTRKTDDQVIHYENSELENEVIKITKHNPTSSSSL